MTHDIFLSYSHTDRKIADKFIKIASARGLRVWYDQLILGGQDWRGTIVDALNKSTMMLIFFSDETNKSTQLIKELAIADKLGKPVVPVLLENIEPSGAYLYEMATRNWVYLHPDPESRLGWLTDNLLQQLRSDSHRGGLDPPVTPSRPNAADPVDNPARHQSRSIAVIPKRTAAASAEQATQNWFPLRYYDPFILGPVLIGISIWTVSSGDPALLWLNLIVISLYWGILAFRHARENKGIFSVSSILSYAIIGFLIIPFGVFPDWIVGISRSRYYHPGMIGRYILLYLIATAVISILQVVYRRTILRRIFKEKIGQTSSRQAA
jgi:TIR domain